MHYIYFNSSQNFCPSLIFLHLYLKHIYHSISQQTQEQVRHKKSASRSKTIKKFKVNLSPIKLFNYATLDQPILLVPPYNSLQSSTVQTMACLGRQISWNGCQVLCGFIAYFVNWQITTYLQKTLEKDEICAFNKYVN